MTSNPDYYHDSRPFNLLRTSDDGRFNAAMDALLPELGLALTSINKLHLKALLVNVARLHRYRPTHYLYYTRNNNDWSKLAKPEARLFNPFGLSRKLVTVVDAMTKAGYLKHLEGFHQRDAEGKRWSVQSRMGLTPKLVNFLLWYDLVEVPTRYASSFPVIRQKNAKGELNLDPLAKRIPADIRSSAAFIKAYNAFMAGHEVDIAKDGHGCFTDETSVYRVFNRGNWRKGGRFAGAWWMNCSREYRHAITLDGEETVELDYSGQHVNLLYALRGVALPKADPYAIQGLPSRELVKDVCFKLINAQTITQAWQACTSEARRDRKQGRQTALAKALDGALSSLDSFEAELVEPIQTKHQAIAGDFGQDMGVTLMRWDSDICQGVLQAMTKQGIPCLSVHDSFLVPVAHEDALRLAMVEAYHGVGLGAYVPAIK